MGNVEVHDLAPVRADERMELNLSRKISFKQYSRHVQGDAHPACLTEIPWSIRDSISLYERMDASFNTILELPPEIPLRLPHLNYLDLSHNRLSVLPESFGLLFHMKTLIIRNNHLKELPKSFTHLVKLEKVDLESNILKELPSDIGQMESLSKLNVKGNKLKSLPFSLGRCGTLTVLIALDNRLDQPPQSICDEGSNVTIDYLRKLSNSQESRPMTPKLTNEFPRIRGNHLVNNVANPHSAHAQYLQLQMHTASMPSKIKTPLLPPLDASKLQSDELKDKIIGLLYGAAIGDTLGLATRWMSCDECTFHYNRDHLTYHNIIQDEHRLHWKHGDWTDNFDQTILVLESLLSWAGVVDELDFAQRLSTWAHNGFTELGDHEGTVCSPTIMKAVQKEMFLTDPHGTAEVIANSYSSCLSNGHQSPREKHHKSVSFEDDNSQNHIGGMDRDGMKPLCDITESQLDVRGADNGALARSLVLGIPCFYKLDEVEANAIRICKATHADSRCQADCVMLCTVIALMLQGGHNLHAAESLEDLIQQASSRAKKHIVDKDQRKEFCRYANACGLKSLNLREEGRMAYTHKPIGSALCSLREVKKDFKTLLTNVIFEAGDSATNSCITGALLGCRTGFANLPKLWVNELRKRQTSWLNLKINALLDMMGIP